MASSALAMAWARETSASATPSSSWAAFTVTVCAVLQFAVVKVSFPSLLRLVPDRVRSVPAWPLIVTVTSPAGLLVSTTVYSTPVASPSVTLSVVGLMVTPTTSSSVMLTVTVWSARAL